MRWSLPLVTALAACGGVRRAPAPVIANVAPAELDAGAAPDDAAPAETCETASQDTLRVAGRDAAVRLVVCDLGEEHPYGEQSGDEGFVLHSKRADLVLDRAGDPVTTTLGTWQDGWESGGAWKLVGTLTSVSGERVALVQFDDSGPAPDLEGVSSRLQVMAVRGGVWDKAYEVNANVIDVTVSADLAVATVATCSVAAGATPTGGGACSGTAAGDGATIELRWDGQQVGESDAP